MSTAFTLVEVATEGSRAALDDVSKHGLLAGRRMVSAAELLAVQAHDVGDLESRPAVLLLGHGLSAQDRGLLCAEHIKGALDPTEMLESDVGVDLRGPQPAMAKQRADHSDVRTALE